MSAVLRSIISHQPAHFGGRSPEREGGGSREGRHTRHVGEARLKVVIIVVLIVIIIPIIRAPIPHWRILDHGGKGKANAGADAVVGGGTPVPLPDGSNTAAPRATLMGHQGPGSPHGLPGRGDADGCRRSSR